MRIIAHSAAPGPDAAAPYLAAMALAGRLQRSLMAIIAAALERAGQRDVNPVQAFLLHALGDQELSARELITRGCYVGSNSAYNLKQLAQGGFLERPRSSADRRRARIRLTPKGQVVRAILDDLFAHHAGTIAGAGGIAASELAELGKLMRRLDRFWTDQIRFTL